MQMRNTFGILFIVLGCGSLFYSAWSAGLIIWSLLSPMYSTLEYQLLSGVLVVLAVVGGLLLRSGLRWREQALAAMV